ncbi:MAG: SdpI family protein [Bacillota bacterium]|nr:SdpI family protein [Bacillota bacterium]
MNFEKIVICLLPIAGLFLSFFYKYKAKGNISKYSGFRTALSMKSKANWEHAHKYAARLFRIYAIFFILLNIIIIFTNSLNTTIMTIVVGLQMLFYFLIGYKVNKDLAKKESS